MSERVKTVLIGAWLLLMGVAGAVAALVLVKDDRSAQLELAGAGAAFALLGLVVIAVGLFRHTDREAVPTRRGVALHTIRVVALLIGGALFAGVVTAASLSPLDPLGMVAAGVVGLGLLAYAWNYFARQRPALRHEVEVEQHGELATAQLLRLDILDEFVDERTDENGARVVMPSDVIAEYALLHHDPVHGPRLVHARQALPLAAYFAVAPGVLLPVRLDGADPSRCRVHWASAVTPPDGSALARWLAPTPSPGATPTVTAVSGFAIPTPATVEVRSVRWLDLDLAAVLAQVQRERPAGGAGPVAVALRFGDVDHEDEVVLEPGRGEGAIVAVGFAVTWAGTTFDALSLVGVPTSALAMLGLRTRWTALIDLAEPLHRVAPQWSRPDRSSPPTLAASADLGSAGTR